MSNEKKMSRSFLLQCCFLIVLTELLSLWKCFPDLWSHQQSPESEVIKSASEIKENPITDAQELWYDPIDN
jgi:hypothetical protein